jgi:hypothetical protein
LGRAALVGDREAAREGSVLFFELYRCRDSRGGSSSSDGRLWMLLEDRGSSSSGQTGLQLRVNQFEAIPCAEEFQHIVLDHDGVPVSTVGRY